MTVNFEKTMPEANLICMNEYNQLEKVIVCSPLYMTISEIINETQKHYVEENINETLATKQHRHFIEKMIELGITVCHITPSERYPEQVFTRDIGFTLGEKVFVSRMGSNIRQGEEAEFKQWLDNQNHSYIRLTESSIEGGDVLIDGNTVYIGVSGRTTIEGVHKLAGLLPEYTVLPIPIDKSYLHLDCVFNVLSSTEALIYSEALRKQDIEFLSKRYHLIEVTKEEQFTLGTNVLSIGNKRVFSLPSNVNVNKKLRNYGYDVIEVDISEIIKSGGSFRCCTLPVQRGEN